MGRAKEFGVEGPLPPRPPEGACNQFHPRPAPNIIKILDYRKRSFSFDRRISAIEPGRRG